MEFEKSMDGLGPIIIDGMNTNLFNIDGINYEALEFYENKIIALGPDGDEYVFTIEEIMEQNDFISDIVND